jgi:hypothetical protein
VLRLVDEQNDEFIILTEGNVNGFREEGISQTIINRVPRQGSLEQEFASEKTIII